MLSILRLTKHQFYYRPKAGKRGRKPSTATNKLSQEGITSCSQGEVVQQIEQIKQDPDTDYGYRKMAFQLMIMGFMINHKKVYRLMQQAQLLKARQKTTDKKYVKYRIVTPQAPLEVLEMDIKQVWVTEHRRHAYILTILDTFTRAVLHWNIGYHMKRVQVKQAWEQVIIEHLQSADQLSKGVHVEIRNDNGPQFGAKEIREFFQQNYLHQVFTHPYTPQENGHIESFHGILSQSLDKQVFWSLTQLEDRLQVFYDKYNNSRIHASIAYLWPMMFWQLWNEGKISRIEKEKNKVKFTLNIPYQSISGNANLREVSCSNLSPLNGGENLPQEVNGPRT